MTAVEVLMRYGFDVNKRTTQEMDLYVECFDHVSRFRVDSPAIYIATVAGKCFTWLHVKLHK